jgi:4-hydroxy-tetrahydrodipicolinate synthase
MKRSLSGVVTAMITPFDSNDNVNFPFVEQLLEFLISKKVNAVFVAGTTGEMFKLTLEERKKLTEKVVKVVNKRIDVCIHVGAMSEKDSIELAQHAESAGADYIACVTPAYFSANAREIEKYFISIASSVSSDFPMYLYNIPQLSGNMLTADIARNVAEQSSNVIGVKYSNSDMLLTYDYLNIKENFSVLQGTDRCFLPALFMGCSGTVSGISCVYPEPFVKVYESYVAGDYKKAKEYQKIATLYCNVLKNGANMAYFKSGLVYRGFQKSYMRRPHLDLTAAEEKSLYEQLNMLRDKYSEILK